MLHPFPTTQKPQDADASGSGRSIDLVSALLKHWKLGLAVGAVIVCAGLPAAWLKGKPSWRAEGVIYVSPRFQRNLDTDPENELQSNSQYREFVQQQVRTISRYDIIERLMKPGAPGTKHWKRKDESERRATDRLRGALQVLPVPDTYQVTVALEGEKAGGLAELVNGAMQSYVETVRAEMKADSVERLRHLQDERAGIEAKIGALIDQRAELARQLGTTVFSGSIVNSYDKMLGSTSEALMEARRQKFVAEAGVGAKEPENPPGDAAKAEALEKAMNDSGLTSLKSALNQRKAELMSRISGLGPQHSGRVAAEKEIQQIDREIERLTGVLRNRLADNLETIWRSKYRQAETVEKRLQNETQKLRAQAESYSLAYQRSLELGDEIERLRKRLNATEDRISFLRLETEAPGWVRVFSPALQPDLPVQGGRKKLFLLVLAAALVVALAVPVGLDFVDPHVRAVGELEFQAGLPAMASLPYLPESQGHMDRESIMRAAVSLRRHLGELQQNALVVSALSHGGGSTTFSLNLASALGRLGVRTLVIEANPQTPDARYTDCPDRPGLIQLMEGEASLTECTLGRDQWPDRVPTGPGNPDTLLPAERLLPVLREAAKNFDLVLVDASPVRNSLATEELIRILGAVIVVADARKDRKGDLRTCMQRLDRLRPEAFGAVLNKVAARPAFPFRKKKTDDTTAVLAA